MTMQLRNVNQFKFHNNIMFTVWIYYGTVWSFEEALIFKLLTSEVESP